jgi:hypothetical protein
MDIGGRLGDTPARRGWLFGMGVMGFGYRLYQSYANLPKIFLVPTLRVGMHT